MEDTNGAFHGTLRDKIQARHTTEGRVFLRMLLSIYKRRTILLRFRPLRTSMQKRDRARRKYGALISASIADDCAESWIQDRWGDDEEDDFDDFSFLAYTSMETRIARAQACLNRKLTNGLRGAVSVHTKQNLVFSTTLTLEAYQDTVRTLRRDFSPKPGKQKGLRPPPIPWEISLRVPVIHYASPMPTVGIDRTSVSVYNGS